MTPIDRHYLSLQFWEQVHKKSASEFQIFFENIAEKAWPGFQKIRPYGNEGDRGNDGYRPEEGIYYQVYSPLDPSDKEADAAAKFQKDFKKLRKFWNKIETIRELNFVYNDKGTGVTIKLEETRAALKEANPKIDFKLFTSKNLESLVFSLSAEQLLSLGFVIDSRAALQNARSHLKTLDVELDKEAGGFVLRVLEHIKAIITSEADEALILEFELVEARALQKIENVNRAIEKYEGIFTRYPEDVRAPLQLAGIQLNQNEFITNQALLRQVEAIDPDNSLLRLGKLMRDIRLEAYVAALQVDENTFPQEPRAKSHFYRIHAILLMLAGATTRANSFIERAISFNPDSFSNHDVKAAFLINSIEDELNPDVRRTMAAEALTLIEKIEQVFSQGDGLSARCKILLNVKKLHAYLYREEAQNIEGTATETFPLILSCHLDYVMENVISELIHRIQLPRPDFDRLMQYIRGSKITIGDLLAKRLVLQFLHHRTLLSEGESFFSGIGKGKFSEFVAALRNGDEDHALAFLQVDIPFAVDFVLCWKDLPAFRKRIIESLPDDGSVQKQKLLFVLYSEEGEVDRAFEIVREMNISEFSYFECNAILKIVQEKKAWDLMIVLLEKLLSRENEARDVLEIKLNLFSAHYNLDNFSEAIRIGKGILSEPAELRLLNDQDKENLVVQTTYAFLKRGDTGAKDFIETHSSLLKSFEAKLSAEVEVYLKSGNPQNALRSLVEGIKLLKCPSPEQYGSLYFVFVQIGNILPDLKLDSSVEVSPGSFVKLKEQERWYYIGNQDELDATKIEESDTRYSDFLGKKTQDKITFPSKFRSGSSEHTLEFILPIEKYILWQSRHHAEILTAERRWDAIQMIEVPMANGTIDPQYLIAFFEDDWQKRRPLFDLYCEQNIPFAYLAASEGGPAPALARIANEQRGFIKASAGDELERKQQSEVAKRIISGEGFYLDGTSALMLSETGVLANIHNSIPGLMVPQSVISMLFALKDKFEYMPGQLGNMGFAQQKISISTVDRDTSERIRENFAKSIAALESRPSSIKAISASNKSGAISEQKIPASLADACILAQKDKAPVLTEDFLYLKANAMDTGKAAPEYCSSIALVRELYEQGKLTFEEYLNFFAFLASYRVRFLTIHIDDLEKAVLGDGIIKIVRPEQLRKFKFALTLSQEYGVAPRMAFQLIAGFLIKVLLDDSLLPELTVKVFLEIISLFPTQQNRRALGRQLLMVSVRAINKGNLFGLHLNSKIQEKVNEIILSLSVHDPKLISF